MLKLPVDEDSWAFRACLYVGMALLVLDVLLPRVFRRRVRLLPPARLLRLPRANPIPDEHFRRLKRDLERQIRALEGAAPRESDKSGGESDAGRTRRAAKSRGKKAKTRVVMSGDRSDTENNSEPAAARRHLLRKHVTFETSARESGRSGNSKHAIDTDTASFRQQEPSDRNQSSNLSEPGTTIHSDVGSAASTDIRSESQVRPDPFSLVDDDFPWQLPNYARPPSTLAQHRHVGQDSSASVDSQGVTLNIRFPQGNATRSTSTTSALRSEAGLELKHKPVWRRTPEKQGAALPTLNIVQNARTSSTSGQTNNRIRALPPGSGANGVTGFSTGAPRPLFPTMRSSPSPFERGIPVNPMIPKKYIVPSPKPPLPVRQPAGVQSSTSLLSTPVASQPKLRTPKIIRRITFDEDMMGALATPSDISPLITESTRKRQRHSDVQEALEAMGLPWHKRRLNDR